MLIVLGGLPGTGKTTLARRIAAARHATHLRVDTIEQALRSSGSLAGEVGPAGYLVAYALAADNLRLGRPVVADSVNPLAVTRAAWRAVAARAGVPAVEVEVVCSDGAEHRTRVETRAVDVPGLRAPGWAEVRARPYDPWDGEHLVLDTAGATEDASAAALEAYLEGVGSGSPGEAASHLAITVRGAVSKPSRS